MNTPCSVRLALAAFTALSCAVCQAQLYETPETRRQQVELQRQAQEAKRREEEAKRLATPTLEEKEAQAREYIGKTFWYLPNPSAKNMVRFYDRIPPSSHSQEPAFLFAPLTITSFVVTGVVMPPPIVYLIGEDQYLLEIKFPDGKVGYVNVVGCCGIIENLYAGRLENDRVYVSTEPAQEIIVKESYLRAKAALEAEQAKEAAAREAQQAKEKEQQAIEQMTRDLQRARENAERQARIARQTAQKEQAKREAERQRRAAMPSPRIGMTMNQVVDQTNWGAPRDRNRTTTAKGTREQWVYSPRRYLYFENGVLVTIQD